MNTPPSSGIGLVKEFTFSFAKSFWKWIARVYLSTSRFSFSLNNKGDKPHRGLKGKFIPYWRKKIPCIRKYYLADENIIPNEIFYTLSIYDKTPERHIYWDRMLFHMFHMFWFIFINCLGIFIFAQLTIIDHLDHLQTWTRLLMLLFWFIILICILFLCFLVMKNALH